jgi:hypothetical protein
VDLARSLLASEDLATHLVTMFDEHVLQVDDVSEDLVSMDDRYVSAGREGRCLVSYRDGNAVAGHVLFDSNGLTSATVSVIGGLLVGHAGGGRSGSARGFRRAVGLGIVFTQSSPTLHLLFTCRRHPQYQARNRRRPGSVVSGSVSCRISSSKMFINDMLEVSRRIASQEGAM